MAGEDIQRVVERRPPPQAKRREARERRQGSDRQAGERRNETGARRDPDEADDGARGGADGRRVPADPILEREPGQRGGGGSRVRRDEGERGGAVGGERRARVEPEPPEPQEARAEEDVRDVVRDEGDPLEVLPRAEDLRGDERRGSGRHVDDRPAREVERAPRVEKAAGPPDPVRDGGVDEEAPEREEGHVGAEAHPLDDRARHERRRDRREHPLEREERERRDRGRVGGLRSAADPREPEPLERTEERRAGRERERVARDHPDDGADPHRNVRHHERVERVLAAHEPGVEEREPGVHDENEGRRAEDPRGVARTDSLGVHAPSFPARSARARTSSAEIGVSACTSCSPVRMRMTRSSV